MYFFPTLIPLSCHSRPHKDGPRLPVPQGLQAHPKTHGDLQRERFHTRGVSSSQWNARKQKTLRGWISRSHAHAVDVHKEIACFHLCIDINTCTHIAYRHTELIFFAFSLFWFCLFNGCKYRLVHPQGRHLVAVGDWCCWWWFISSPLPVKQMYHVYAFPDPKAYRNCF